MLRAIDLGYRLPDERELFHSVSFEVTAGEAVAIEGPSGVGKSTLLALLGGLLAPTHGSVIVSTETAIPFAWVLQSLNTLAARSVLANACVGHLLDDEPKELTRSRALEALELLALKPLAEKRARSLSGGELQRLTVARALVSSRPIILADEPSNQLDRRNAQLVMQALVRAADSGRAVVIVTHDRAALPDHCRVLRLTEHGLDG